jgi:hypothetical protein
MATTRLIFTAANCSEMNKLKHSGEISELRTLEFSAGANGFEHRQGPQSQLANTDMGEFASQSDRYPPPCSVTVSRYRQSDFPIPHTRKPV